MPKGVYDRTKSKPRQKRPLRDRFWEKVNKSGGCWTWTGAQHRQGYGHIRIDDSVEFAHRVSWNIHFGAIPDGAEIMHVCDNPCCVNPDHLMLGTHRDNMRDMARKGRKPSKLKGVVSDIKTMAKCGWRQQQIADYYGVSQSAISMVISGHRLEV